MITQLYNSPIYKLNRPMKIPKYEEEAKAVAIALDCDWKVLNRTLKARFRRIAQAVIKAHEKKNKP